jgi:hypothetical protein
MYSEKINRLIEFALIDGILSEKERVVLLSKAKSEGIDIDEFEMVLEARLFEKQNCLESINDHFKNDSVKELKKDKSEEIQKCPACGEYLSQFSVTCSACSFEFQQSNGQSSIKLLLDKLTDLETSKSKTGNSAILNAFSESKNTSLTAEKCHLIKSFVIPNSKFEILSFFSTAIPLARKKTKSKMFSLSSNNTDDEDLITNAWRLKCEQIIIQSRFSMIDDKKSLEKINNYGKEIGL